MFVNASTLLDVQISGAQIPGVGSSAQLNFVRWNLIVGPQCGVFIMHNFWLI